MWDGKHDGLHHGGMVHEDVLNLAGHDLRATAIDQLLAAPGQEEIPVAVQVAGITCAEPPIDEGLLIGLGVILVARDHAGTVDDDLPGLAAG